MEDFLKPYWEAHPDEDVLLVVGKMVFLQHRRHNAEAYALEQGVEIEEVQRPKAKKAATKPEGGEKPEAPEGEEAAVVKPRKKK